MDLAASIQDVTEEIVLRIGRHVRARTGMKHLVIAGGVGLNCVANGRLLRDGAFDDIWIQPAAGDAGGALGGGTVRLASAPGKTAIPVCTDAQQGSFLGPRYTTEQIVRSLGSEGHRDSVFEMRQTWSSMLLVSWPMERSSGGFKGGWNLVLGHWERGASWAILDHPQCRRR